VDLIHFILYLNFVMSSWWFSDLPVSGQITAFAISGKMMTSVLALGCWVYLGWTEMVKQWCASFIVSAIISWDKFCCLALRRTMTWGVWGVTIYLTGVFCLRCEFGVDCDGEMSWREICSVSVPATLGGGTVVCTLWDALFSIPSLGASGFFVFLGFADTKILANRFKAIVCSLPTWQNGPTGCGCNRACVRSDAAWVAKSWDDGNGKVNFCGKKSTVSTILFDLVLVM
jgi:hypothetical protein